MVPEALAHLREVWHAEQDPQFRERVIELSARGLRLACGIGIALTLSYLVLTFLLGRSFSWDGHAGTVALWDKVLTIALSSAGWLVGRTRFGGRHGRLLVALVCLSAALASVFDDLSRPDTTFSSPWIAAALFVGLTTTPFPPLQAVLFCLAGTMVYVLPLTLAGEVVSLAQVVFLVLFSAMAVTVSSTLYRTRFQLFGSLEQARKEADANRLVSERLKKLERMKARFFLGISHDARAPLALIAGPVQDLLDGRGGELTDRATELLRFAQHGTGQLEDHMEDLLDLARMDVGELPVQLDSFDIGALVNRVVADHQPMAERSQVVLSACRHAEQFAAIVDPARMRQTLENLVTNGLKYAGAGGTVSVCTSRQKDRVVVEVRDDGPGIAVEDQDHIFERFYRSADASGTGLGLGLSIAAEMMSLMGGSLSCESQIGEGTRFVCELSATERRPVPLPVVHAPAYHETEDSSDGEAQPDLLTGDLRDVLVVDDNEHLRAYMRSHVGAYYRVTEKADGREAWDWLQEHRPALVISDVMMPRMDGIELCRRIRANVRLASMPVVLLTARGDEESKLEGLRAGADEYLFKPFNSRELLARCENLIEIRERLATTSELGTPSPLKVESAEAVFLARVKSTVESLLDNYNFGVDWLADEVGLSTRQLHRRVRSASGISAAGLIRMLRLGRAAQLLAAHAVSVAEAAHAVGLRDVDHFSRLFRQAYGVSPSQYEPIA